MIDECSALTRSIIERRWPLIERVAEALCARQVLSATDLQMLLE